MLGFGAASTAIPCASLPASNAQRLVVLYTVAGLQGFFFGAVYASFQTCMWSLLPPHADLANVMGFAALAKVSGCGLGNFLGSSVLHSFSESAAGVESIHAVGYSAMCGTCAALIFASAVLLMDLRGRA